MRYRLDLRICGCYYKTLFRGSLGQTVAHLGVILARSVNFYRVQEEIERCGEFIIEGRSRLSKGVIVYFTDKARARHKGGCYHPYTGWYNAQLAIVPIDERPDPEPEDDEF